MKRAAFAIGMVDFFSGFSCAHAQSTVALPEIEVVAPMAAPSAGNAAKPSDSSRTPTTVEVVRSRDFGLAGAPSVLDTVAARLPSVQLTDPNGNAAFQELRYRGFVASPQAGQPQGVAVYQNGIRLNEAFGDTVNWDLIPPAAINRLALFASNPAFGLNAIGGAVSIEMKNGFTWTGLETRIQGGSYGRVDSALQYGVQSGAWGFYVAADGVHDDGYRLRSPTELRRVYSDLGYRTSDAEIHVVASAARNTFGVAAATPVELSRADPRAIFTTPQSTLNEAGSLALIGRVDVGPAWTIQANAYLRQFHQVHIDGNTGDFENCSSRSSYRGRLCLEDDGFSPAPGQSQRDFRDQFLIVGPRGQTIPFQAATPYGTIDRTKTDSTTAGGTLQATNEGTFWGHSNTLLLGASLDHSDYRFHSSSMLGYIFPDLSVGSNSSVLGTGLAPIRTQGSLGYAPVSLGGRNTYLGAFAAETFNVTDRLAINFAGRLNIANLTTRDLSGLAPELDGQHSFVRFNPAAGVTYNVSPGMVAYGSYAEANRAPTPLELSCSDPARPCLLENSLVADPPLRQVVSRTYEFGLRGTETRLWEGRLSWRAGLFRTTTSNDILAVASTIAGRGYYVNVPQILRQGIELSADYQSDNWNVYANYSALDATFRFNAALASPNNPHADANGTIFVRSGNSVPLSPKHQLKAGVEYAFTSHFKAGMEVKAVSSSYYVGDESNLNRKLPPYYVANLRASYAVNAHWEVFGLINNVLNKRYATYGTYFETGSVTNALATTLSDARTTVLAKPFSVYAGVKATW